MNPKVHPAIYKLFTLSTIPLPKVYKIHGAGANAIDGNGAS